MQDEKKESRFSNFVKRAKKYAVISLGIGSLLFGGGKDQQQTDTDINNVKMVQSVTMPLSEKINFIVDNMLESNEVLSHSKIDKSASKINSQAKKDLIRQNLLKYTSVPDGEKLLSALDVTKIQFVDVIDQMKLGSPLAGLYQGGEIKRLSMDFEDIQNLPLFHHELTHALQDQTNSYTKDGELAELEAHLNETKFTEKALQQGIINLDDFSEYKLKVSNYQKYNYDDAQFTLHYLHPNITWNYQNQLLGNKPATNEQLYQYAQHLGLSGQKAQQFVQKLSDSFNVERIEYSHENGREYKVRTLGDEMFERTKIKTTTISGVLVTTQYERPEGAVSGSWKEVRARYEKGKQSKEFFYDMKGNLIKETKTSLDGTTEIKELKDGKWVTSSQALQQRLQKASGKTDSIPVNKQSSPEM